MQNDKLLLLCKYANQHYSGIVIFIFTLISLTGCKSLKIKSDRSIQMQFEEFLHSKENKFVFKEGVYRISAPLFKGDIERDISISGEGKVVIELIGDSFLELSSSIIYRQKYLYKLERGANELKVDYPSIKSGDILEIRSKSIGEKGWKYKKSDIHIVDYIDNGIVRLKDELNFSYDVTEIVSIVIRKPIRISISNIVFKLVNTASMHKAIAFSGGQIDLDNISCLNEESDNKVDFLQCYACVNSTIESIKFYNLRYGILLNNSRNVVVKNIYGEDTNHAVAPSTWSTNIVIDGYTGKNTAIDAHMAFDITYMNVDIDTGLTYFNCRALGITLKNCKFVSNVTDPSAKVYIGPTTLVESEKYLAWQYDINLVNVDWVHNIRGSNGLSVSRCRNLTIENCRTHLVSTKGVCKSIEIEESSLGSFKCYDSNFRIVNCMFDNNLIPVNGSYNPLSCSFNGIANIVNTEFKNYRSKYLFSYIHDTKTMIKFSLCKFSAFKGIAEKVGYLNKKYIGIEFDRCTFTNKNFLYDDRFYSKSLLNARKSEN